MNPAIESDEGDEQFKGRDWRTVQVQEIIDQAETRFVELDTSIEDTTKLLIRSGAPNVVLVRESRRTKTALATFGYDDLMAYLLLVLGMSQPDEQAARIAERAGRGETLALKEVTDHLGWKQEPAYLPHTADLMQAVEKLGGGQHRIVVCKEGTTEAIGVLSQLRMVRFFWQHHRNFAAMEKLYSCSLGELGLGAKAVVAINGDKPLADALRLMHDEGITSLPVLDSRNNVVGNISHVDTRVSRAVPLFSSHALTQRTAPYRHLRHPTPLKLLHPLHLCHPLRTRRPRRQRLLPRLPRHALQYPRAHRRQTLCHAIPPNVDRRRRLSHRLRAC